LTFDTASKSQANKKENRTQQNQINKMSTVNRVGFV
jgi:hypothetical protein